MHHVLKLFEADDSVSVEVYLPNELLEGFVAEFVTSLLEHYADFVEVYSAVAVAVQEVISNLQTLLT